MRRTDIQNAERLQRIRTEMEFIVEPQVRRYCGPIFFTCSLESALGNITNNGSFGLVDTGKKKILVTCSHVLQGYKSERQADPKLKMCLCLDRRNPVLFTPDAPLGESEELDLVTFDMAPFLSACDGLDFYSLQENPPRAVEEGDTIMFVGFPGKGRLIVGDALGVTRAPYGIRVVAQGKNSYLADVSNVMKNLDDFPGISGTPCFLVRQNRPIRLVGFATALVPLDEKTYLRFTHASCINQDATIKKPL